MKKKIVSLLLTLCMLVTLGALASCGEKSAAEIVNAALEKTNALDSYAADMALDISMSVSGVTMDIPMNIEMKAAGIKSGAPVISAAMTMEMLGISVAMDIYSDGEWMYIDALGEKYKMSMADASGEYDYTEYMDSMLVALPEDMLADKELIKNEDGSQSITIEIPSETFTELYGDLVTQMNSTSTGAALEDISITDAVVTITVADEYVKSYDISFGMTMNVSGTETTAEAKAVLTIKDPGTDVTVTAPEGLEDYAEIDADELA